MKTFYHYSTNDMKFQTNVFAGPHLLKPSVEQEMVKGGYYCSTCKTLMCERVFARYPIIPSAHAARGIKTTRNDDILFETEDGFILGLHATLSRLCKHFKGISAVPIEKSSYSALWIHEVVQIEAGFHNDFTMRESCNECGLRRQKTGSIYKLGHEAIAKQDLKGHFYRFNFYKNLGDENPYMFTFMSQMAVDYFKDNKIRCGSFLAIGADLFKDCIEV